MSLIQEAGEFVYAPGYAPSPYQVSGDDPGPNLWDDNDDLKLLSRLTDRVRLHEFNLGVFASQSHQLVRQTLSTLRAVTQGVVSIHRGDFLGAVKAVGFVPGQRNAHRLKYHLDRDDISGAWLAMQYGYVPALADIYSAAKAFENLTYKPRKSRVVVSGRKTWVHDGSQAPSQYSMNGIRTYRKQYIVDLLEELDIARGLGLMDLAPIAHELLPWSFVVDWFVPIGDYLDILSVIPHIKANVCISTSDKFQSTLGAILDDRIVAPGFQSLKKGSFSRSCSATIPIPKPVFRQGLRGVRIANAVALAHQSIEKAVRDYSRKR
jgi:hypothetical protein